MNQFERNKTILAKYIPEESTDIIARWIVQYDFKLKIKRSRSTKLGDYRPPVKGLNHQITINHDLNKYAFLITLIHEVAHLVNWNKHQEKVLPHGEEWKQEYRLLMEPFMRNLIFPEDISQALRRYMQDPAASSCSDISLTRVLKKYDLHSSHLVHLEEIPIQTLFDYNGRQFIKGNKVRTRFKCKEVLSNRYYLFNPIAEVTPLGEVAPTPHNEKIRI
jgi:SprT protein